MDPLEAVVDQMDIVIEKYGWGVITVGASGDDDERTPGGTTVFSYTVGLTELLPDKSNPCPEIMVLGLPAKQAHWILNRVGDVIKLSGEIPPLGVEVGEIIGGGYKVKFREVFGHVDEDLYPAGVLARRYDGKYRLFQLLWPDLEGKFPGEAGYDPQLARQVQVGKQWQ